MSHQEASTGQIVQDNQDKTTKPKDPMSMHIKVYSPFKVYFDQDAQSISAVNDTGPFDILPQHHNFMTLINPCDLVIRIGDDEKKIRISRGIMHVKADQVVVFLDV